jgi:HD-GYP domain-containing protein (c-di-GMP phosphodiesterase class II)
MILGQSLYSIDGDLLLSSWTELDDHYIQRIADRGFSTVYVHEPGTEDAVPHEIMSDRLRMLTQKTVYETHEAIKEAIQFRGLPPDMVMKALQKGTEYKALVNVEQITECVQSILDEIFDSHADTVEVLFTRSTSGYLIEHSIDVAVYALVLGKQYEFKRKVLVELGMAGLLHDIGKLVYPQLIEKPSDTLFPEEQELLKEHPSLSVRILERSTDRYFHARNAILYHHENQDGSGYPLGIRGFNGPPDLEDAKPRDRIFPLAELLAVTNVYDNYLFSPNTEPQAPADALSLVLDDSGKVLNKHMVRTWARMLNLYPPGATVVIEKHRDGSYNGFKGVVIRSQPGKYPQPVLVLIEDEGGNRIAPLRVDLSADPTVQLKLVI